MDPNGIPTAEELGAHETPPVVPAAEPEVEPAPEAPPKKAPKPEPEVEPEDEEAASDQATVEDLANAVTRAFETLEEKRARKAAETADEADLSEDEKRIKALTAENERLKAEKETTDLKASEDAIVHQVKSTAGKYKMTDAEVEAVGNYFEQNPTLIGVWSFERGALYVLPELRGRLNSAPPAQPKAPGSDTRATGVIDATTGGPALPQPFKHDGRRRDYTDITRHALASGEAAKLGTFK